MIHGQTIATKTKPNKLEEIGIKFSSIHLKAMPGNKGLVYVGGHEVSYKTGYPLMAGEEMVIQDEHIDRVFITSENTGNSVAWYV